ncbi:hypothetical protein [Streptomyces barkulensis]|uniref:hypothetical protein n=1 Tax=Streptomyces barkulensis TaxID=1257026 RepID=UPI001F10F00C|nr:hypothetical protein [Streptomyces barkulensis]
MQRTEAPRWTVAALLVLNTLGVVALQVRVARGVRDLRTATRHIRAAGTLMPASCAAFALTAATASPWTALPVLLAAACLQVLGETALASGA